MTFDRFLSLVCPLLDLEWRKYRRRAARHRVEERMKELGVPDFPAYLDTLRSDPAELAGLADLMRVTVTRFFRDRESWWELKDMVLPGILAQTSAREAVRAWSAGCCGGEEPYSLAIIWQEQFASSDRRLEILATDIDAASLERASAARYGSGSLREVPPEMRERWFGREGGLWRVRDEVKRLVRFEERNLMTDPPPSAMDLILCRYLPFTYYRTERLAEACRRLHGALRPGGVLVVGRKERLSWGVGELFEAVEGCRGIYRRMASGVRDRMGEPSRICGGKKASLEKRRRA